MIEINVSQLKKYASVCKVLYVEDEESIREATKKFLNRFFENLDTAVNGIEALEKYNQITYDIVITDINMPKMDGLELIEHIKGKNYEQHIVVTSAYTDSERLLKLLNLNIEKFVEKPFHNKQFLYILYKLSQAIYTEKRKQSLKKEIETFSKNNQLIFDAIPIGIVQIKNNDVMMVNQAFLKMGGFDSFDTLKIEMPDIGVLFENSEGYVNAQNNKELIEQLKTFEEDEKRVKIFESNIIKEYQVSLTTLQGEANYLLTFTDITAMHDALYSDIHTHLPNRKFILEELDIYQKKYDQLVMILLKIKNYKNIAKWYGIEESILMEHEFADSVKGLVHVLDENAFIGYFAPNNILIVPDQNDYTQIKKIYETLKSMKISSSKSNFSLGVDHKIIKVNTNKKLTELEAQLISDFELL